MNPFSEVYTGFKSLLIGMRITLGQFFKAKVTVHYPRQTLKIPARYRGHIELVGNPETGKPLCFVCKLCQKACPSDCIAVEGTKFEGDKRKSVTSYRLDFTKCSLCGACVEVCREGAIRFSRDYNLAGLSKEEFHFDLICRFWAQQGKPVPEVGGQRTEDGGRKAEQLAEATAGAARATEPKQASQLIGAAQAGAHPGTVPGVRPSPGAAATERAGALECLTAAPAPDVAAPGDGRTPVRPPADGAMSGYALQSGGLGS